MSSAYHTKFIPAYTASTPKVLQAISKDADRQLGDLSATLKRLDGVHCKLIKESEQTWYDVCPKCKDKVNRLELGTFVDIECQTEKDVNDLSSKKEFVSDCFKIAFGSPLLCNVSGLQLSGSDRGLTFAPILKTYSEEQKARGKISRDGECPLQFQQSKSTQVDMHDTNKAESCVSNVTVLQKGNEGGETISSEKDALTEKMKGCNITRPHEIPKLGDGIDTTYGDNQQLASQNEKLRKGVIALQTEHIRLRGESQSLEDKLEVSEGKTYSLEQILKKKEEEVKRLKDQLQDEKDKMAENALQQHINYLESQQQNKLRIQQELEEKFAKLKEKKKDANSENENVRKTLDAQEVELNALKTEKEDMTRDMKTLRQKNEQLEKKLNDLEVEKAKMQTDIEQQMTDSRGLLTSLSSTNSVLQQQINNLTCNKARLASDLESLQQDKLGIQLEMEMEMSKLKEEKKNANSKIENFRKKLDTQEAGLSALKTAKDDMTRDMNTFNEKNKQIKNRLSALEREKAKMQTDNEQQLADLREHKTTLSSTNTVLLRQINNLTSDKARLASDLESLQQDKLRIQQELEKKMSKLKEEKENANSEMENFRKTLDTQEAELSALKTEKEDRTRYMKTLNEKNEQFKNRLSALEGEKSKMKTDTEQQMADPRGLLTTLLSTNSVLQRQINSKEDDVLSLKSDNDRLKEKIHCLKEERKKSQKDMNDLESLHKELKSDNKELQNTIGLNEEENRKLKMEIFELTTTKKKSIVLGMRYHSSIGKIMVDMVTRDLTKRLERVMDMTEFDLTIKLYQKASETPKGPMVVLCLNKSFEANIRAALTGIEVYSDVTVVVLYHTSEGNLSHLTPANRRVSSKELKELGAILDMAFSSDSGLYDCDLNTTAIDKLATILKKS